MKAVTLVIGLLFLSLSAQALECEPTYTGGRTKVTAGDWTKGNQALAEFKALATTKKVESKTDELGLVRYQKVETQLTEKNWNSGRPDCNDYQTAKLKRVCTKTEAKNSTVCANICEQSSYSDDCR